MPRNRPTTPPALIASSVAGALIAGGAVVWAPWLAQQIGVAHQAQRATFDLVAPIVALLLFIVIVPAATFAATPSRADGPSARLTAVLLLCSNAVALILGYGLTTLIAFSHQLN
jgi:hypothetical protein